MKRKYYVGLILPFFLACAGKPGDLSGISRMEIIQTDTDMSDMALKDGFHTALLAFAHDSLIKPEEGKFPIIGKAELNSLWAGQPGTKGISWKPFRAEASASGDLGYTIGYWTYDTPDSTYYGNYYTIWKKSPEGTWKWVVDGGNNTPRLSE